MMALNNLDALIAEYAQWCNAQGLTPESADELLAARRLTPEQRRWVEDFITRWDAAASGLEPV